MKRKRHFIWATFVVLTAFMGCAEDPPDYDVKAYDCDEVEGTCTQVASALCAIGFQPLTRDDPNQTNCRGGHCCIPEEPETTCSLTGSYNCIPGDNCSRPWKSVEGSTTCNEGRVCCAYRP